MDKITKTIKQEFPNVNVAVGGAPLNDEFRKKIGADIYSPDPQGLVEYLNSQLS